MGKIASLVAVLIALLPLSPIAQPGAPQPFGALPSERQMDWHQLDYYAFVHFNINTFSGEEWGHGTENPAIFNPEKLDCRQWARTCKAAGMKGIIITAKHHDGFCIWPSKYTDHSVKNSPWRNGKGDLLKELSEACREYGLKMGVYLSPWDRNNPIYGTPEYNKYFVKQLEEVLTNYGEIFEVWFDGAVSEEFKGKQIYDWEAYIATVRKHQPNAVIFSDAGPDIRWVGNERGFANEENWNTLNRNDYFPGTPRYLELRSGNKNGTHWLPAEADVSIRPGWYYHKDQDDQVKSPEYLEWIYYHSVGRNANLLLNLPVDRRGLVHENDARALMGLRKMLDVTFANNLAARAKASTSAQRGTGFTPDLVTDGDNTTYWAAPDGTTEATLELSLPTTYTFNVVELREFLPLGQRITSAQVEAWINGKWVSAGSCATVGNRALIRLPRIHTDKIRIHLKAMACPTLSTVAVYHRPHDNYLLESKTEKEERMQWWRDAGFGMFIHWGAYAVPGGVHQGEEVSGAGEWIMNNANIPVPDYEPYARTFNPVKFNAREWATAAKAAGMRYIVITSKHHDGFCLWDSKVTDYDIMDTSPFKRDILKELKEACDEAGIVLGFYYSIMDWHHPDAQGKNFGNPNPKGADFTAYRDNYMKPQLRELIERYDPAILWFDGEWIPEWTETQGKDLYQYVRSLKPDIIINNRVGKGRQGMQGMNNEPDDIGDFGTPEQEILDYADPGLDWESCMTMNGSWGFKKSDLNWKSSENLIHNLVDIAAKGGNYLLNIGPDAEGLIPAASLERLKEMGEWLKVNGEVVYNSKMWPAYKEGEAIRYAAGQQGATYAVHLGVPAEKIALKYARIKPGTQVELLGHGPLTSQYSQEDGLIVQVPAEARNSALRHAWTFRMEATKGEVCPPPAFELAGKPVEKFNIFSSTAQIELKPAKVGDQLYYTLDGSTPSRRSTKYTGPLKISGTTEIKAIAYRQGLTSSPVTILTLQKSLFNQVELTHPYAEKYNGGGPLGLVDGRRGSLTFSDGRWQGFEGKDFQLVIDLGKSRQIQRVKTSFLRDIGSWIFAPEWVMLESSEDGVNFKTIERKALPMAKNEDPATVIPFEFQAKTQSRYLRVTGKNIGICPVWHAGAGGKSWLFVDEVTVE